VLADVVHDTFSAVQRRYRKSENHQIKSKAIALFRFVTQKERALGTIPSRRELQKDWNQAHPEWAYSDMSRQQRFHRVRFLAVVRRDDVAIHVLRQRHAASRCPTT
jgi:hypothetical protein